MLFQVSYYLLSTSHFWLWHHTRKHSPFPGRRSSQRTPNCQEARRYTNLCYLLASSPQQPFHSWLASADSWSLWLSTALGGPLCQLAVSLSRPTKTTDSILEYPAAPPRPRPCLLNVFFLPVYLVKFSLASPPFTFLSSCP